jgi:SAM-dependent methyltransferase
MDLRPRMRSDALVEEATRVLDYQPFMIRDDIQTGVGYSWLHWPDPREAPPLVFHRAEWPESDWDKISASNQGLRSMYDAFIRAIAQRYPGGSLLDIGCNNGYFPVAAEVAGMRGCAGVDQGDHNAKSIRLLNSVQGTEVEYFQRQYSPERRSAEPLPRKFDVVSASAILCHIPDPLHFLAYLASMAQEAVFFWGQVLNTESFIVSYNKPHRNLSSFHQFPYHFNDNTRLSLGLLKHSMSSLGFRRPFEIPHEASWIPMPEGPGGSLESELAQGSHHRAFLFMR